MRVIPANSRNGLLAGIIAANLSLCGCATASRQISPTVMALPASGETFAVFQQHDAVCRQFAAERVGAAPPRQVAATRAATGAALGAGVGAAAGALIGSASGHAGRGAAVGAGTGLLAGVLAGSARDRARAAAIQQSYDMAYAQCMVANGELVEEPARSSVIYAVPARMLIVPAAPYAAAPYPPPPPPPQ